MAEMAVPILLLMAEKETNAELRDRAKIALLRIAPDRLSELRGRAASARARTRMLRFEVIDEGSRKASFSISLPWALADLALAAIPDEDKQAIRRQGYDIRRIMARAAVGRGADPRDPARGQAFIRIWME